MVITLRSLQRVPPARRFDKFRRGVASFGRQNRRRSLSSPASKSKIILSLGVLTIAINRSSESCNTLSVIVIFNFFFLNNHLEEERMIITIVMYDAY